MIILMTKRPIISMCRSSAMACRPRTVSCRCKVILVSGCGPTSDVRLNGAIRTSGILNHIEKEIKEIVENPHDLEEWIDIIILALDGAWRCGRQRDYTPEDIMDMLDFKQLKNFDRVWVLPADPNPPCEHQREEERESNP
jgi:hypothetical protein